MTISILGLKSKGYLSMTISDLFPKGTCYWLSRIELQKVPFTDYLRLNSKRYLWVFGGSEFQGYHFLSNFPLNSKMYNFWLVKFNINLKRYHFKPPRFTTQIETPLTGYKNIVDRGFIFGGLGGFSFLEIVSRYDRQRNKHRALKTKFCIRMFVIHWLGINDMK